MSHIKEKIVSGFKAWQPFVLCIVTAAIFWFFNALNHDYTAELKYPVTIVYDKEKLIPVEEIPKVVTFNATGYGWNFLRESMQFNQKPVYIKPIGLPKKNFITSNEIFALFAHQLNNVKINYFINDTIPLHFDYLASKTVVLSLDTHGLELSPGYRISGPVLVQPGKVDFTGPAKAIKKLSDTLWLKMPAETYKGGVDESIPLETASALLKPSIAEATIQFYTRYLEQKLIRFKVHKRNFPSTYRLTQDSVEALIFTDPDDKNKTAALDSLKVVADYRKKSGNKIELSLVNFSKYAFDHRIQNFVKIKKNVRQED